MREYIINSSVRSSDNIKGEKGVISSIEKVSNKVKENSALIVKNNDRISSDKTKS